MPDGFWAEEFDLGGLTYPQFLAFFFDRPVVADKERYNLFHSGIDYFVASQPAIVVSHLLQMCQNFSELPHAYSVEQIDQGLWAVFGAGIDCQRFLFDPTVDNQMRLAAIESMYVPFRDFVTKRTGSPTDSFYWMWWDMILHTFWLIAHCPAADDYAELTLDLRKMADAMYQTLLKILTLDHKGCQWSALHGLGHLHHPLTYETVQTYLRDHLSALSQEEAEWIERCSSGKIA